MRELFRTLPLMCLVLMVPVVPFLFFGEGWQESLRMMRDDPPPPPVVASVVVGLLTADILLPVPSGVVGTLAGWQLGWWRGTLAVWTGLTAGAVLGFALARRWGRSAALWFCRRDALERMRAATDRYGPLVLVLTRAVPVLAEAGVFLTGIHRLSWGRFLVPVLPANLGIALAYAAFGDLAERHGWPAPALAVSVALPILTAAAVGRWLPAGSPAPTASPSVPGDTDRSTGSG